LGSPWWGVFFCFVIAKDCLFSWIDICCCPVAATAAALAATTLDGLVVATSFSSESDVESESESDVELCLILRTNLSSPESSDILLGFPCSAISDLGMPCEALGLAFACTGIIPGGSIEGSIGTAPAGKFCTLRIMVPGGMLIGPYACIGPSVLELEACVA